MKKLIALVLALLMVATVFAACGGGGGEANTDNGGSGTDNGGSGTDNGGSDDPFYGEDNITLLVWAADNALKLTTELCDEFKAQYPDKKITIEVKAQGEGDVGSQVANDPDKAADVFSFACDQINDLVSRKLLTPVYNDYLDDVQANNTEFTLKAATIDGKVQAYPQTGENGYYLVYDKQYVTDEDAKTLEGVLAACRKAGKKFVVDCGNGFFSVMFPFTGGLELAGLEDDGTQIFNDYDEDKVIASLDAFAKLFAEYKDVLMSADCARISSGLAENPTTVAAGIDGSWNAANVATALGDNFGAAKLPTINIDGTDTQIKSFNGCKLIGVNSHTKFPESAQLLANFLTGEASQKKRLEAISWAPSNKNLLASDEFKSYKALSALIEQSEYALPQINVATNLWSPLGTLGNKVKDGSSKDVLTTEFKKAIDVILNE